MEEIIGALSRLRIPLTADEFQLQELVAEALRSGKLGVMDYYEMKNTIADTAMRDSIASMGEGANAPRKK